MFQFFLLIFSVLMEIQILLTQFILYKQNGHFEYAYYFALNIFKHFIL